MPHPPYPKPVTKEYLDGQRLRWLVRRVLLAKRLLSVAISPPAKAKAAALVLDAQEQVRAFRADHPGLV